jgi:L-rhamnose mutarotase
LVEIGTHEDYERMFNESWPEALKMLKRLCEAE